MRLNIIVARNARNVKTVMVFGFGQLLCGISWAVEGWQGRSDFFWGGVVLMQGGLMWDLGGVDR